MTPVHVLGCGFFSPGFGSLAAYRAGVSDAAAAS